jgi:menaquinone-dependent protoporphyrinogen oxidase
MKHLVDRLIGNRGAARRLAFMSRHTRCRCGGARLRSPQKPRSWGVATMCEAPVFYATTEGQTRRIAETIAATLRDQGVDSLALDMTSREAETFDWSHARLVIVGASVHAGRHQRQASAFVRTHLDSLNGRPSVFFSVSLATCSAIPAEVDAARRVALSFPADLGWRPGRVECIAGRLAYTQYGLLTRFIMRRIARKAGGSTDTSRDHEMTNWADVRALARDLACFLARDARQAALADAG